MKKKLLLLLPFAGLLTYIAICGYNTGAGVTGGIDGTGASNTGGCSCHTHATTTTVSIELDSAGIPVTSYVGGGSYSIKITGTNTGASALPDFGFQIAAVNVTGAGTSAATNAGTLASTGLPVSCRYTPSGTYGGSLLPINVVEHSAPIVATTGTGGSGTTYVESIGWTAPAAGTGSIKLYGAINAVNLDGSDGGDAWNNNNITITEYTPAVLEPITGTFTVCAGGSTTPLSSTYTTGTWSCTPAFTATISATGVLTGILPGTAVVSYNEGAAGVATVTVTVVGPPTVSPVSGGVNTVCAGATVTYSDVTTGGTWASSATSVATVSATGVITGISGGTVNISYTLANACTSTTRLKLLTVSPLPSPGTLSGGATGVCAGSTVILADTTSGGTWSSASPGIATVDAFGDVTGLSVGVAVISYSETNSCGTAAATESVTVSATTSAGTITGPSVVCQGDTIVLADTATGGVWSSSDNTIGSIGTTGVVMGISGGSIIAGYTVTNGCGSVSTSVNVTVNALPSAGAIIGASGICAGVPDTLTETVSGGTWSASNSNALITTGGVAIGLFTGTDTILYSLTNTCGTSATSLVLNITGSSAGTIIGDSSVCAGNVIILTDSLGGGTWSSINGSALISGAGIHAVVAGATVGTDTVIYSVPGGCGIAISSAIINVLPASACWPTGVANVASTVTEFKVYPNPSTGLFNIDIPANGSASLVVTDVMGKVILSRNISAAQGTLDLSDLPSGNYILKATAGDNTYREKISIIK